MEPLFNIGERKIGSNFEPLLIAEIGINHGGSLKVAKEMVDAAYRAGIEVVKHQTHIPSDEYSKEGANSIPGNANVSIVEIMEKCALSESDEYELYKYTKQKGMIFISTPFSIKALHRIIDFDLPAIKVGSGECSNYPLLRKIGEAEKPIILSTGMNNIESIKKAINCFSGFNKIALLHTTNLYPTPHEFVRLSAMMELKKHFPNYVYGLSDHTTDSISSLGAVALGASIVERHFTDKKNRKGPDIVCSMDEKDARELISNMKLMKNCLSPGAKKEAHPQEKVTINFAFASVVSISNIKKHQLITKEDIWVKRPGTGEISAENYDNIIGRVSTRFIPKNTQLKWSDFE
jgi:N-acetylneuraminate synthase